MIKQFAQTLSVCQPLLRASRQHNINLSFCFASQRRTCNMPYECHKDHTHTKNLIISFPIYYVLIPQSDDSHLSQLASPINWLHTDLKFKLFI